MFKKIIRVLHLWLGLAVGLVVFCVATTGALYTFQPEIEKYILDRDKWVVKEQAGGYLPLDTLINIGSRELQKLPNGRTANEFTYHKDPSSSFQVGYDYEDSADNGYRANVLLNPYTGKVLWTTEGNAEHWIWEKIVDLHTRLMLGDIGFQIVIWSNLLFLVMAISGIILWWPKNKAAAKQRFWFRWKKGLRWKRKNYDVHSILGFYASWIVVFMIITGAMWSFEWFSNGVYFITSLGAAKTEISAPAVNEQDSIKPIPHQAALINALYAFKEKYPSQYESTDAVGMGYFSNDTDTLTTVFAMYNPTGLRTEKAIEASYNKFTGRFVRDNLKDEKNVGDVMLSSTNEMHYGTFFGLTSKILTVLGCLVYASLPITGFYIWWGRTRKKGRRLTAQRT